MDLDSRRAAAARAAGMEQLLLTALKPAPARWRGDAAGWTFQSTHFRAFIRAFFEQLSPVYVMSLEPPRPTLCGAPRLFA